MEKNVVRQIVLLGLSALALAAFLIVPKLVPQKPVDQFLKNYNCDLRTGPCTARDDSSAITVEFLSGEFRSMTPLNFQVQLENINASEVILDLRGRDMYMGINQVKLQPVPDQDNLWHGTAELAICTTGEMIWQGSFTAITDLGSVSTSIEFAAK